MTLLRPNFPTSLDAAWIIQRHSDRHVPRNDDRFPTVSFPGLTALTSSTNAFRENAHEWRARTSFIIRVTDEVARHPFDSPNMGDL